MLSALIVRAVAFGFNIEIGASGAVYAAVSFEERLKGFRLYVKRNGLTVAA